MIQLKCNLTEIILDNLVNDGKGNKKVTVGLAEEADGAILVRKINGLFVGGNQLHVENVKPNKVSKQFLLIFCQILVKCRRMPHEGTHPGQFLLIFLTDRASIG